MKYVLGTFLALGLFAGVMTALTNPWPGWPILALIGASLVVAVRLGTRRTRLIEAKSKTARLEAEMGVPLMEGLEECKECGKPLVAGAKFCSYCRALTTQTLRGICTTCGTRNQPDALWCSQCGGSLVKVEVRQLEPSQTSLARGAGQRRP